MIQLNLLPDIKKEFLKAERLKRNIISLSILISIAAVGLTVLLALYVHGAQRIARNQVENDISKYTKELEGIQDLSKILTVQNALAALPGLHQQKHANPRMFDYLKVLVPNEVSLSKLDLQHPQSTLTISASAADYKSLNVFADTLKNAQFSHGSEDQKTSITPFTKVTVLSANNSADPQRAGIDFSLSMTFDPVIFDEKSTNPLMTVPNITTGQGFVKSNELFTGQREETAQ